DDPSVVVFAPGTPASAQLAVFLPGTSGKPEYVALLLSIVARQGYRVIGLEYNDVPAVAQVCPRNPNPACSGNFREERIYGDAQESPVENTPAEAIVPRLTALLRNLAKQHPGEGWKTYLSGDAPDWSKIVLSGLSQGAGMAAY